MVWFGHVGTTGHRIALTDELILIVWIFGIKVAFQSITTAIILLSCRYSYFLRRKAREIRIVLGTKRHTKENEWITFCFLLFFVFANHFVKINRYLACHLWQLIRGPNHGRQATVMQSQIFFNFFLYLQDFCSFIRKFVNIYDIHHFYFGANVVPHLS